MTTPENAVADALERAARAVCCPDGCLHARENGIFCSRPHYQDKAVRAVLAFLDAAPVTEAMLQAALRCRWLKDRWTRRAAKARPREFEAAIRAAMKHDGPKIIEDWRVMIAELRRGVEGR